MVVSTFDRTLEQQVVIVTGLSGSGKNVVMRALEDLGFYCVDNLPVPLVSPFLKFAFQSQGSLLKVALVIDVRGKRFLQNFIREIEQIRLEEKEYFFKIIFLDSSDETLIKRFQETRRAHPLAKGISVSDAIRMEKELLEPVKQQADIILNTDNFNIHELRKWVQESFSDSSSRKIFVNLISFGFKYGIPVESNMICDVRFLPNPYFIPALKSLDGRTKEIQEYLFKQQSVSSYWDKIKDFLTYSIKKYYDEGHSFVNVAIGCTGGRHRSVSLIERLSKETVDNTIFLVHHRDIDK